MKSQIGVRSQPRPQRQLALPTSDAEAVGDSLDVCGTKVPRDSQTWKRGGQRKVELVAWWVDGS